MNPSQQIDPPQIKVCPECFTVLKLQSDHCPGCGANHQRRESLDRALMLVVVLLCFGLAWGFMAP